MKKNIVLLSIILASIFLLNSSKVSAGWWERPSVQPTQPSIERSPTPTQPSQPTEAPTSAPTEEPAQEPTVTSPPNGGLPTSAPTSVPSDDSGDGNGGDDGEDACESGKSYTGPYCGWSPSVGEEGDGGEDYIARIGGPEILGGPEVLGLSDTSSENLNVSDIMLLAGVLCLLLYARSKMLIRKAA